MSTKISGSKYAAMYGPTTGDKVRLADTNLVIEVEKDYTTYGDEVKFGGGKTIRDGIDVYKRQVQEGLRLAAKASAIAVSRPGATASIPLREEVLNSSL